MFPVGNCVVIIICHCGFTTVNSLPGACRVAILIYFNVYGIASVVVLSRKDTATQYACRRISLHASRITLHIFSESHYHRWRGIVRPTCFSALRF